MFLLLSVKIFPILNVCFNKTCVYFVGQVDSTGMIPSSTDGSTVKSSVHHSNIHEYMKSKIDTAFIDESGQSEVSKKAQPDLVSSSHTTQFVGLRHSTVMQSAAESSQCTPPLAKPQSTPPLAKPQSTPPLVKQNDDGQLQLQDGELQSSDIRRHLFEGSKLEEPMDSKQCEADSQPSQSEGGCQDNSKNESEDQSQKGNQLACSKSKISAAESSESNQSQNQYPAPGKKRSNSRQAGKIGANQSRTAGDMKKSSGKKCLKSEYDFPDSPDDEGLGKTPSSYMALSGTVRSPRRGHVDGSDSRTTATAATTTAPEAANKAAETPGDGSSIDRDLIGSQSKDQNKSETCDITESSQTVDHGKSRLASRGDANKDGDDSSVSLHGVDSTRPETGAIGETDRIDSSTDSTPVVASNESASRSKPSSPRVHSSSPRVADSESSTTTYEAADNDSQSEMDGVTSGSFVQQPSRSPRSADHARPHPSLDAPKGSGYSFPATQPVVSTMMQESVHSVISRDQESAPCLSAQYEMLSDDED